MILPLHNSLWLETFILLTDSWKCYTFKTSLYNQGSLYKTVVLLVERMVWMDWGLLLVVSVDTACKPMLSGVVIHTPVCLHGYILLAGSHHRHQQQLYLWLKTIGISYIQYLHKISLLQVMTGMNKMRMYENWNVWYGRHQLVMCRL